ncbi:MAG: SpvB/TcaC N-terminal domain-containing protein [Candidatus Omnitrophota bacterium]|nr:SpvB/TcaC N-terminal domain-containing protein [Candidatus Omnitrophota bacterium]
MKKNISHIFVGTGFKPVPTVRFLLCLLILCFFTIGMSPRPKPNPPPLIPTWWLSMDLGKTSNLIKVIILWDSAYGSTNYSIQGSLNNSTWVNLQANLSSAGGTSKEHSLSGSYRYLRIYINKAQNTYPIIYEVKIYGSSPDTTPPVIVITSPQDGAAVEGTSVQLQGTIDGVPFSESRPLNPGENILVKTAVDAAGNQSSISLKVYLYPGQLIGPEGGEVSSADGRVKVIIPPGALNKPTKIEVSTNIDKDILNKFKSSGKALLSVVRCERYPNLNPNENFNIPVTLIYTLEQAQVPGTPAILGLYDNDGGIFFTGDPSFVEEDGVTVTFKIGHFSTYGALQSMVSQGAPIGSGVKIPLPDMFTGSFSHSIPLIVPPGRKSMQPSLSLNYRSSNSNSWAGVGFSLNPGYIVRSTRLGPPKYTDDDTFYLITDGGTTEMTRLTEKLYQAKIESSFTKFYKEENGSWRVVAKDGSELLFGDSADSREVASKGTFAWYLTRAQDTNGNYITYAYWPKEQDNKCYLKRIDYTGNKNNNTDVLPLNSVEFFLEGREDVPSSYLSGSKIAIAKRLREIVVRANLEIVWTYKLEYKYCEDTNRSFIKSITQSGSDGKSFPAQVFDYQKPR